MNSYYFHYRLTIHCALIMKQNVQIPKKGQPEAFIALLLQKSGLEIEINHEPMSVQFANALSNCGTNDATCN